MVIFKAQVGLSWNLIFYKMGNVQLRNWISVMFTALGIVFLHIVYRKTFHRSLVLLTQNNKEKSQQFRFLSYNAEIINEDRSTVSLKSA